MEKAIIMGEKGRVDSGLRQNDRLFYFPKYLFHFRVKAGAYLLDGFVADFIQLFLLFRKLGLGIEPFRVHQDIVYRADRGRHFKAGGRVHPILQAAADKGVQYAHGMRHVDVLKAEALPDRAGVNQVILDMGKILTNIVKAVSVERLVPGDKRVVKELRPNLPGPGGVAGG